MNSTTMKKALAGGVLVLSGLAVGGMAAGTMSASAATSTPSATASSSTASRSGSGSGSGTLVQTTDPTKSMRSDEHLLTGTTAEKVKAAANRRKGRVLKIGLAPKASVSMRSAAR